IIVMQRRYTYFNYTSLLVALLVSMVGCKKQEYALPTPKDVLQNDVIKRTQGPNIVGQSIEFAYAMAILPAKGKLVSSEVEASIAGATGTYLENNSYYTNQSGVDVGVPIGQPSVTIGTTTTVTFTKDTSAATLRYFYNIPPEARGKTVSFKFTAKSSNGETVSYSMGPYTIAKMDMVRNLAVSNNNLAYISIADMAVYNAAAAAANAAKIDLVYLYRNLTTSAFNHALVSPAADTLYLPGVILPAGVNRSTKMIKVFNLQDYNLAQLQYGIYIDDLDFQQLNFAPAPNFAINLKAEAGVWVETADSKYRAYIYINSVNSNGSAVISIKRLAL
ncbi:MAG TPA: DUF4466 family protein, partial [Chitinophagaceae bacterium]|nr:DUF4466 family protein [Chitinophagaceae bacterium]